MIHDTSDASNHIYRYVALVGADTAAVINEWCEINLRSRWYMSSYDFHPPVWNFESRDDHLLFGLRWS